MSADRHLSLRRRARLLAGCALAAAIASPGQAQKAFDANPSVAFGSAGVVQGQAIPGGLRDTVTVNTRQAVINWTPTDTAAGGPPIAILPQNNQLVFTADPAQVGGAYTILNRIVPADPNRPVQFDGRVIGQFFGSNGADAGAHVWFYSPGGIIAGATSRFDVGSLVLTANDITVGNSLFIDADANSQTGTIAFRAATDSRAGVTIQSGAQINAPGNYVALVAPRVNQGGTVTVDGSAALIAAESVNLTIPVAGNLFDIVVNTGSNVNAGGETTLTHNGSTNVTDPSLGGQPRRVYMMAVPKNDAVTMLVSGAVGYVPASSAVAANGTIFLTTASSIAGDSPATADTRGTINVTGGRFGNTVRANAQNLNFDTSAAALSIVGSLDATSTSGTIAMTANGRDIDATGQIRFGHFDPDRAGGSSFSITSNPGSTIHAQDILLSTTSFGLPDVGYGATSATGGTIDVRALGGIITADNDIRLTSTGRGGQGSFDGNSVGGNGIGGTVRVAASGGGRITGGGLLTVAVNGEGEQGYGAGGSGFGGTVGIQIASGGSIVTGGLSVAADGNGAFGDFGKPGGSGTGGNASLTLTGGTLNATGIGISATGSGVEGGSTGRGGSIAIASTAGSTIVTSGGNVALDASGRAGDSFSDGPTVGDGTGGSIAFVNDASMLVLGEGSILATAEGAAGFSPTFAPVTGRGGTISFTINAADPNNPASTFQVSALNLSADGRVNLPLGLRPSVIHSNSGTGVGGSVALNLTGGTVQTNSITLSASGAGANGDYGNKAGAGFAGRAELAMNGAQLTTGAIDILAEARGGDGALGETGYGAAGSGGDAGVGTNPFGTNSGAYLTGTGGTITAGDLTLSAVATGGFGGDAQTENFPSPVSTGAGDGGTASGSVASINTSGVLFAVGRVQADASGTGGGGGVVNFPDSSPPQAANAGAGGAGAGGTASIAVAGGDQILDGVEALADGFGGIAGEVLTESGYGFLASATSSGGAGGSGTGGIASISFSNANVTAPDSLTLFASATASGENGGTGPAGGAGGTATGGTASIRFAGGSADVYRLTSSASARAGFGRTGELLDGGAGGDAIGGNASIEATNGAAVTIADRGQSESLIIDASAFGGSGGDGGSFAASGFGGKGGTGGNARAGSSTLLLDGGVRMDVATTSGIEEIPPTFFVVAEAGPGGTGGTGSATGNSGGAGGNGGTARAGSAVFETTGAQANFAELAISATALPGFGGGGGRGAPDPATGQTISAAPGATGNGFGGHFELSLDDALGGNAPGIATIGFLEVDVGANGYYDGSLLISDQGNAASGGLHFGSLFAHGDNGSDFGASDFLIRSTDRVIAVDDNADFRSAGKILFDFQRGGGLSAGATLDALANSGITVTHDARLTPDAFSLNARNIQLRSFADVDARSGSLLTASNRIDITSEGGTGHVGGAVSGGAISIVTHGTATVDTLKAQTVSINAGFSNGLVPGANAVVTDAITTTDAIGIEASQDAIVSAGARLVAGTSVSITTGDDIVIGAGALVRGANNAPPESSTDPLSFVSQVRLLAGGIGLGSRPAGEVASILMGGTIEAPDRTVLLSAGAVQADPLSRIATSNLYVRINNAPVGSQTPSDDGGQLGSPCLEGSVCLGTLSVDRIVRIGEAGHQPLNLRVAGGIDAVDVLLRAGSVTLGQAGISNNIKASAALTIEALNSDLTLNGPITITGGNSTARVAASGSITGASAQLAAPATLDLYAGNNVTLGSANAQAIRTIGLDGTVLNPTGLTVPGSIAVGQVTTGSNLSLTAGGNIAVDSYQVTGAATLTAANGTITVTRDAAATNGTSATARAITLNGANGLRVNAASATAGNLTLVAASGDLNLAQANVPAGDIALTSGNGTITLGQVAGGRGLTGTASGLLSVNGNVGATTIAFTSGDIAIGPNGQLGSRTQTTGLTLTSTSDRSFVGGSGGASGWRLDSTEIGRIGSAGDIIIAANPLNPTGTAFTLIDPASATLVLDAFTFNGNQLGPSGTLTLRSARSIGVVGAAQFAGFNANQTVLLDAGRDISIAAETGSLAIRDSSGGLTGTLRLNGQQVYAMSAAARNAAANLTFAALHDRLATNDGAANDGGYLQAGRIAVGVGNLLAIQNSGANSGNRDDRRGYTANALTIQSTGNTPAQISINGRLASGSGFITGTTVFGQLTLRGSFDTGSFSNGCVFGSTCVAPPPPPPTVSFDFLAEVLSQPRDQVQDEQEEDSKEQALQASQLLPDPIIRFLDVPVSATDPLIDQPVTGTGNEDLWEPSIPTP